MPPVLFLLELKHFFENKMHIISFFFSSFAGSYTSTPGINVVRRDIAHFISQRDGYPAVSDDILLTDGGSEGIEVSKD